MCISKVLVGSIDKVRIRRAMMAITAVLQNSEFRIDSIGMENVRVLFVRRIIDAFYCTYECSDAIDYR